MGDDFEVVTKPMDSLQTKVSKLKEALELIEESKNMTLLELNEYFTAFGKDSSIVQDGLKMFPPSVIVRRMMFEPELETSLSRNFIQHIMKNSFVSLFPILLVTKEESILFQTVKSILMGTPMLQILRVGVYYVLVNPKLYFLIDCLVNNMANAPITLDHLALARQNLPLKYFKKFLTLFSFDGLDGNDLYILSDIDKVGENEQHLIKMLKVAGISKTDAIKYTFNQDVLDLF